MSRTADSRVEGYRNQEGFFCAACMQKAIDLDEGLDESPFGGESFRGEILTLADLAADKREREYEPGCDFAPPRHCEDCGDQLAPRELYPRG